MTIELDLSRPWDADDPDGFGERRPARGWRDPPRWLVPALLVIAVVAVLGGGTAAPPLPDPVLALPFGESGLVFGRDDTVFLAQQRARSGRLQAYRPGRAAPLWTADYVDANPVASVTSDPGLVVVTAYPVDPRRERENVIEVRESHTGATLWERVGLGIIGATGGLLVLTDYRGWGGRGDVDRDRPGTVVAVDVRTGVPRWSHPIAPTTLLAADQGSETTWLAELAEDGALRMRDPGTGAVRSTVRLPLSARPLAFMIEGGTAVVIHGRTGEDPVDLNPGPESVIGYDLVTGATRWRSDGPDLGFPCDRYLCEYGTHGVTVIDPDTGAVRYRGPADRIDVRGDLLIASVPVAGGITRRSELWDLTTGRKLRSFGWRIVSDDRRHGHLAAQNGVGGVLTVAVLDLATGTARVVGRARDWAGDPVCTFGRRYLGCSGPGGVRIWRVPAGARG